MPERTFRLAAGGTSPGADVKRRCRLVRCIEMSPRSGNEPLGPLFTGASWKRRERR
jgi:hypothetical protein